MKSDDPPSLNKSLDPCKTPEMGYALSASGITSTVVSYRYVRWFLPGEAELDTCFHLQSVYPYKELRYGALPLLPFLVQFVTKIAPKMLQNPGIAQLWHFTRIQYGLWKQAHQLKGCQEDATMMQTGVCGDEALCSQISPVLTTKSTRISAYSPFWQHKIASTMDNIVVKPNSSTGSHHQCARL